MMLGIKPHYLVGSFLLFMALQGSRTPICEKESLDSEQLDPPG